MIFQHKLILLNKCCPAIPADAKIAEIGIFDFGVDVFSNLFPKILVILLTQFSIAQNPCDRRQVDQKLKPVPKRPEMTPELLKRKARHAACPSSYLKIQSSWFSWLSTQSFENLPRLTLA